MAIGKQFFDFIEDRQEDLGNAITTGLNAVDSFIDNNIPGGKQYTENWSRGVQKIGNTISTSLEYADRQADERIESTGDLGLFLIGSFRKGANNFRYGAQSAATAVNVDPRAGDYLTGAAEEVALFGAGKLAKGVSKLPPPRAMPQSQLVLAEAGRVRARHLGVDPIKGGPVFKAVTVDNKQVLDATGRKLGEDIINSDPKLAKHLVHRRAKIQRLENEIDRASETKLLEKLNDNPDPKIIKTADRAIKRNKPKLYSERSNVLPFTDDDPQLYGAKNKITDGEKFRWVRNRKEKGKAITEHIHKHHLVTKGGTSAAFRKMEDFIQQGKADMDDLVLMAEYAQKKGAATGDRLSNNAYILDTPHSELHQQVLKPAGDEFKQKQWQSILNELKTPEQLMEWWVDQVDNNYVPNKNTGLIWQDLDDLLKEIRDL